MQVKMSGIVNEVFVNKDRTRTYATVVDTENGGICKFSVDGELTGVKGGELVTVDAEFKARPDNAGGTFLSFVGGDFKTKKGGGEN